MRISSLRLGALVGALAILGLYNTTLGCGGSTDNTTPDGAAGSESAGGTGSSSSSSSGGSCSDASTASSTAKAETCDSTADDGNTSTSSTSASDTDGDGTPDATDTDDDGDAILDTEDPDSANTSTASAPNADADGDGTPNGTDTDDDGDAIDDTIDPDDDNDGIADTNESGGTANPDLKGLNTQLVVGIMDAMEPHFPDGGPSADTATEDCSQGGSVTITTAGSQESATTTFAFTNCREPSKDYQLSDSTTCKFTTLISGNFTCTNTFQEGGTMKIACQTDGELCGAKIVAGIGTTISQNVGINLTTDIDQSNVASNFSGNACVATTSFPITFENALSTFTAADVSCE